MNQICRQDLFGCLHLNSEVRHIRASQIGLSQTDTFYPASVCPRPTNPRFEGLPVPQDQISPRIKSPRIKSPRIKSPTVRRGASLGKTRLRPAPADVESGRTCWTQCPA